MRTAQILLGLTIAPAKKDLLGMDTHAQVKKTFNSILIPTEIYRMWPYLWDLSPSWSRIFFSDITVAYIYRYGWVQQCNPYACDITANYTKTKGIHSYTYYFSY